MISLMNNPEMKKKAVDCYVAFVLEEDDFFQEMILDFLGVVPERVQEMEEALHSRKWHDLGMLAHQLCGATGMYRLPAISELAKEIEQKINQDLTEEVRADVVTLRNLVNYVILEFQIQLSEAQGHVTLTP